MKFPVLAIAALSFATAPVWADDISDALKSALEAYEEGDTKYALEELEYAKQLLMAQKTDALVEYLPEPPDGWTREINTEMNAGLSFIGGGTGAEASYTGDGSSFTITIMADNPMVGAMAGMIGNAAVMGAKIERVGRQKFMLQNNELNGMVDGRILIKASGGEVDQMISVLETIDYRGLKRFGL